MEMENQQQTPKWFTFLENLQNLTGDGDINNYHRGGGDTGKMVDYYKARFSHIPIPAYEHKCKCGTFIKKQCYLYHKPTDQLIVVGSCCYLRFIPKVNQQRYCKTCNTPLKRRLKETICKECEEKDRLECKRLERLELEREEEIKRKERHEQYLMRCKLNIPCYICNRPTDIRKGQEQSHQLCVYCVFRSENIILFPIGKYRGKPIHEIRMDKGYMAWFLNTVKMCKHHTPISKYFRFWLKE